MMLTRMQRDQFLADGYLVIPDVVPVTLCQQVVSMILDYHGIDPDRPDSWQGRYQGGHGIVPVHHDQSLWDVRQCPNVYKVFRALYDRDDLWVSLDRASYKPPASRKTDEFRRDPIHWDCDPWRTSELGIQGLVYLTDTAEDQGAFCCVPEIYQNLNEYLSRHEGDEQRHRPEVAGEVAEKDIKALAGSAGSLVLFHRLMPHSSLINVSDQPRFVQYVAMSPTTDEQEAAARVDQWQHRMPPVWAIRQRISSQQIPEPGAPARLTSLGRRLVGVDSW